jgi:hypothetical protein
MEILANLTIIAMLLHSSYSIRQLQKKYYNERNKIS